MNILQYESKIWATADLLRGSGIKESEWPSFMMPFFALTMIESRLVRMFDELKKEIGKEAFENIQKNDVYDLIRDKGQGYNIFIFEKGQTLADICKNDKSFEIDFDAYLKGFDGETKDLLGVDSGDGEKFLDIKGVITKPRRSCSAIPPYGQPLISNPSTTLKSPRWKSTSSGSGPTSLLKLPESSTPQTM